MRTNIERPRHYGLFREEEAQKKGMCVVVGEEGSLEEGNFVRIYTLIDLYDGCVVDAKFQLWGQTPLIAAAEEVCQQLVGKPYTSARKISEEVLDSSMRDRPYEAAFSEDICGHLSLICAALQHWLEKCEQISFKKPERSPPKAVSQSASLEEKIDKIEQILDKEIRPYIEQDEGGITIVQLTPKNELIIAYQGACTSCFSAVGSTLSAIQQILREKIDPAIVVIPDEKSLDFV